MDVFTGTIAYESRGPNAAWNDWGPLQEAPIKGLLVVSYADGRAIDSTLTDAEGKFSINVPSRIVEGDHLRFWAAGIAADGARIAYAVADPGVGPRLSDLTVNRSLAEVWYWHIQLPAPSGSQWVIREAADSGALRMFDWMRYAWAHGRQTQGREGSTVVLWWSPGTTWTCDTCFLRAPADFESSGFDTQIFMSGDARDAAYWSDALTLRQLGHWSMASYGANPNEAGMHCLGVPTMPGLAWTHGWAAFYSSDLRRSPRYYGKQGGTFFWFDLDSGYDWLGRPFAVPSSTNGMLQQVDENWIAQSLWKISRSGVDPTRIHEALGSAHMREPPYARGYTRHSFDVDTQCRPTRIVNTGVSAPMFADFLDALRCDGIPAAIVSATVAPYPYPAERPICR